MASENHDSYGPISCSIMNYYKKFGQNRDLEKFLRLHQNHRSAGKSLSEESLYCSATAERGNLGYEHSHSNSCDADVNRSLQNLSVLHDLSADKLNLSSSDQKTPEPVVPIVETVLETKEVVKNKKGVNINFESVIEISMPQNNEIPAQQPIVPLPPPPPQPQILPQFVHCYPAFISAATIGIPTAVKSDTKMSQTDTGSHSDTQAIQEEEEERIIPTKNPPLASQPALPIMVDCETNYSPTSSIASHHKQKLEWDSMADVGYTRAAKNEDGLNSIERNALTKLFANYGLNVESNIILLSSKKSKQVDDTKTDPLRPNPAVKAKWKRAFDHIKNQHNFTNPKFHSTPIDKQREKMENFCQTSRAELVSQGVQVTHLDDCSQTVVELSSSAESIVKSKSSSSKKSLGSKSRKPSTESLKSSHSMIIHETPIISPQDSDENIERYPSIDNASLGKYENEGVSHKNSKTSPAETEAESFEFVSGADYLKQSSGNGSNVNSAAISTISSNCSFSRYSKMLPVGGKLSKLEKNLTVGINLMNSLLQSKSLSTDSKNVLIKKIIAKLEKMIGKNCDDPDNSDEAEKKLTTKISTELRRLPSKTSNSSNKSSKEKNESKSDVEIKSISSKGNQKSIADIVTIKSKCESKSSESVKSKTSKERIDSESSAALKVSCSSSSAKSEWLEPLTHAELNHELLKNPQSAAKEPEDQRTGKNLQLSLIEANIKYLEKLKDFLQNGGHADNFLSGRDIKFDVDVKSKPTSIHSHASKTSTPLDDGAKSWRSHCHDHQKVTRSKLKTPNDVSSNESVNTFARHKKEEFLDKYHRMMGKKSDTQTKTIYTRPENCSVSTYYSNVNKKISPTTKTTSAAASTMSSTELFLSSSQSNYNNFPPSSSQSHPQNIATQTTDSLRHTTPVFQTKFASDPPQRTKIVTKQRNTKGNQITPRPISYTIRFRESNPNRIEDIIEQPATARSYELEPVEYEVPTASLQHNQVGLPFDRVISSENLRVFESNRTAASSLQTYLVERRPNFVLKAEERRKYIAEINYRRHWRNVEREQILKLNPNTSIQSKLNHLPNTHSNGYKLFSTNQIKVQNRKTYRQLPEVIKRKEANKENQMKRNNKKIMDIFNKNLQQKVLKGKVSLSNSLYLV